MRVASRSDATRFLGFGWYWLTLFLLHSTIRAAICVAQIAARMAKNILKPAIHGSGNS